MPSPLAHIGVGLAISYVSHEKVPASAQVRAGALSASMVVSLGFSLLPDFDSVAGILADDFGKFHNNATHSLVIGAIIAALLATAVWGRYRAGFKFWFLVSFSAYSLHIIMDAAVGDARGVLMFWPLSLERYRLPIAIFYGLHWSDGWVSLRHLWTALTEAAFLVLLYFIVRGVSALRSTSTRVSLRMEEQD